MIVAEKGCPASMPASSRVVVPELPASSGAGRGTQQARSPSDKSERGAGGPNVDRQGPEARQVARVVGAWREIVKNRASLGEGREQGISVAD